MLRICLSRIVGIPSFFIVMVSLTALSNAAEIYRLDDITVTAFEEKIVEQKQKEPAMKAVYSSEDLKKMNLRNAWEFFKNVAGITVMEYTGGKIGQARIAIRGQMDHAGGANYAVFVDDVPLNEPGGAGPVFVGQADLNTITPETIDYVEVYKGPFSIDAGDFNTSGVIKFYTKKYSDKCSLMAEGGSYGYARSQLSVSNDFSSNFKHFTSVEYKRQDGFAHNTDIDYFINANTNITYGDLKGNHTTLSLNAFSYDAQVPTGFGRREWLDGEWKLAGNDSDGRTKDQVQAYLRNYWMVTPKLEWVNLLWGRHWEGEWWEDTNLVWPSGKPSNQTDQFHERDNFGYRSQLTYVDEFWGRYLLLNAGFDLRLDSFATDRWRTDGQRNRVSRYQGIEGDYTQIAGYARAEFDVMPSLRAYLGGRYDFIKYKIENDFNPDTELKSNPFSPKAGITWQALNNLTFFAQAATGTRTPDPQYASEDGVVRSINYEAGSKGHFLDGKIRYMISGFYNRLEDVNVRDANTKEWLFEGEMEIPGFEVELSAQVMAPITVWGVFGYSWPKWETPESVKDKGVVGVDPWNLSLGIDWNFPFGLEGRIEYITNGRQWMTTNYDRKEDDYYNILNIYTTYHYNKNLDIFLKLNNILDERYCMWPAYDYYRPEPGFNFSTGIKLFF